MKMKIDFQSTNRMKHLLQIYLQSGGGGGGPVGSVVKQLSATGKQIRC